MAKSAKSREFSKELGAKLRYFRKQRRLSQEQLAVDAGLNTNSIGMIERGQKNPTIVTLKRMCDSLGISLATLFLFKGEEIDTTETACERTNAVLRQLPPADAVRVAEIVESIANIGKK